MQGELRDDENSPANIQNRQVHSVLIISEYAQVGNFFRKIIGITFRIIIAYSQEHK
jgi:hypothetical protein